MSPSAPRLTVFKAKPFEMSYSDAMSRLRMWLDFNKIQPCGFKITAAGKIGFELTFSSQLDATAFGAFEWPRNLEIPIRLWRSAEPGPRVERACGRLPAMGAIRRRRY